MPAATPLPFRKTPMAMALLMLGSLPVAARAEGEAPAPYQTATAELDAVEVRSRRDDDFQADHSSVGAKTDSALRDIPQTVTVVTRAVLDAQNATTLTEALRNVPGITLSAGEGGQIGDNVNLRGFTARTDIFLDGMRDRAQYRRDTFELERVEVLKGPSSLFFGRGSTGGVINQVTKLPTRKAAREFTGSIGSDDWYRGTLDVNQPIGERAAVRLNAFAQDVGSTREVIENRDYGFAPSLRLGIGSATELAVSALVQRNQDIPDYGIPFAFGRPAEVPLDRFYGDTDDYYDQQANVLRLRLDHHVNEIFSLRNQILLEDTSIQARPTPYRVCTPDFNTAADPCPVSPPGTPVDQITVQSDRRDRLVDDYSLFNQFDAIAKFATGPLQHTLIVGIEAGQDRTRNRSFATSPRATDSLGNFTAGPTPPGTQRTASTDTRGRGDTLAFYANDTVAIGEQLKLVGGIRRDRYEAHSDALAVPTGAHTVLARKDEATSLRAGLIWQPTRWLSHYAAYGSSFNPSAEAVTITAAQALVAPEKTKSYEVGSKADLLGGALSLSGALFLIDKTDARTTDPVTSTVSLDGHTQVRGLELGAVGRISTPWQLLAGYTLLDSELVSTRDRSGGQSLEGNRLPNTPRHSGNLFTTYALPGGLEAGAGVYYVGARYLTTANTTRVDDYVRTDLTLSWKQPAYDLRLNLQNVFDTGYYDAVISSANGRAVPGRGRTIVGTLAVRF